MYQDYFKNDSNVATYIKNNDYYTLGKYIMSNSYAENRQDAAQLYREGKALVKQGRIYNSLLNKGDDKQKQAVTFLNAINEGGPLPKYIDTPTGKVENEYTKKFIDKVNSYFKKGDIARFTFQSKTVKRNPIPGLGVLTDWMLADAHYDTDGYEDFLKNIGMSDNDFQDYIASSGGSVGIKNGVHFIDVTNRDIRTLGKIAQALNKTKNIEGANRWGASMLEYEKDDDGNKIVENGRFKINEDSATNIKDYNNNQTYIPNLKGYALGKGTRFNIGKSFTTTLYNPLVALLNITSENLIDTGINMLMHHFATIGGILDSAESTQNELYEQNNIDNRAFQIQRTGYKSAAHKRLEDAWAEGLLDSSDFTKTQEIIDKRYDLIVGTAPYTQKRILGDINNEEGDRVLKEISLEDKATIQEYISKAYEAGKLKYDIGNYGDEGGVYINIPAGALSFKDRAKYLVGLKGTENSEMTIFVPDLLPKAQYDLLDRHTEVQASRELQSIRKYKYDYELSDSSKITVDEAGNYIKIDKFGKSRTILPDEALADMNREKIIEVAAEQLHDAAYAYNNNKFIDDTSLWTFDHNKLVQIAGWCVNAVNELYPDLKNEKDTDKLQRTILLETTRLYNQIRHKLNLTGVSAEYVNSLIQELTNI